MRAILAEALGTFWLVLAAAMLAADGLAGGAAAGLAHLAAALTLGRITGGHFNPALTIALRLSGGFRGSLTFTLLAQIAGAVLALAVVDAPDAVALPARWSASLAVGGLIALLALLHVAGRRHPPEGVHATAAALAVAVALAPGGHGAINAAHATAAWLTGEGAPLALWLAWAAALGGAAVAAGLARPLREE